MKKLLIIITVLAAVNLTACTTKTISDTKAKQIALNDADVIKNEVNFTYTYKDNDKYLFRFENDEYAYEYDIDSHDGSIDHKEMIEKTYSKLTKNKFLTKKQAEQIALEYFNFNKDEITKEKIISKKENDEHYYQISFVKDNHKYSIKINSAGTPKDPQTKLVE